MSTRRRVRALEAKSGAGFRVAVPELLDCEGKAFARSPDEGEVAGVRYCIDGTCVEVRREDRERIGEFDRRSQCLASRELNPTVVLIFGSEFV